MKKLLITGFEPFGGEKINPSWEAVLRLPDKIGEYSIEKLLLPVVFGRAAEAVIRTAGKSEPDIILAIGQAGGRDRITPELVAINLRYAAIADNSGLSPCDEPILKGAEDAHFSTLPVRKMASAIADCGIPAKLSYSAGAYVCNDTLFLLLEHFKNTKTRVGFIHIPYCNEQNKTPSLPLDSITKALAIAIESIDA